MATPILLDTCAIIWIVEQEPIAEAAREALRARRRGGLFVSPISAWEVGLLIARGRLVSRMAPHAWFRSILATPGVDLSALTPDILIASSFLPGDPPRDPADRIITATARELGCALMTRDRALLAYAAQGHVEAIAC